jgi:adenylate cyclase class IV
MFLSRLQKRCEIIDINNPSETVEILKSLNFKKISENSIEKSKTYYDTFENIIY